MYRIGVDVGGTNTDAVILNINPAAADTPSRGVLASSKTPTTQDVTSGIMTAVDNVLKKADIATEKILSVAIGTTHFVNAVVEADARRLSKVAVVRLCNPFTRQV
jgi:N-methylhydantoinase A/oxoprolinase/acetone carboxylase beta subunit